MSHCRKITPSRKPHQCDKCDKVLSSRSNLKKHMITHDTSKPFTCDECEAVFNQNRDLKTHIMQVTKDKLIIDCMSFLTPGTLFNKRIYIYITFTSGAHKS